MVAKQGLGSFINGSFECGGNIPLGSNNPSQNFADVFITSTHLKHVDQAVSAAKNAYKSWRYQGVSKRTTYLLQLKDAFQKNEEEIAQAISAEMGKIISEARIEAKSLSARIDLMINHGAARVKDENLYELRAQTRYHQQGVLAVIGPYNFPAHLVNAHVIPSILMGNTVVIKPSQVCPMVGEIYARSVMEAGLPAGVVNMVQGDGTIGQALCSHSHIDGVLFTGSYNTGRALQELLLDQPHKILALELGGKNCALVMDDADLEQAALEIIQGAFLTTGQRCTATSRVLAHEKIYQKLKHTLSAITKTLAPVSSDKQGMFGPLATKSSLDKFFTLLERAKSEGANPLVESKAQSGGAFVTPSLYEIACDHPMKDYLGEELFGPNICLEPIKSLDQAIERINQSPYGLSNSVFTLNQRNGERLYHEVKCGVLNINRSTNGAFGQMPFGGVNKSGNQRPAGIDAVKYATFPVAITSLAYGESPAPKKLKEQVRNTLTSDTPLATIALRHEIESTFELFGVFSDQAALDRLIFCSDSFDGLLEQRKDFYDSLARIFNDAIIFDGRQIVINLSNISQPQKTLQLLMQTLESANLNAGMSFKKYRHPGINVPKDLMIPRSRAMLDRLYKNNFVPREKKTPVIDLQNSRGAFLASVDDNPLVLFDAASQIATVGAGFYADTFQNAYDQGSLDSLILDNAEDTNCKADFENFLHEKTNHQFKSVGYGAGGAEANEIAFDMCRQNGPGGTKIIAFEGSFHGRTIMSLHATFNKAKSGPFIFKGFEASFLPFPNLTDPNIQPKINNEILAQLEAGKIPDSFNHDDLLRRELETFKELAREVEKGNICGVIIEPMQCEGGDRYASNRFFNGLRALTRALNVPLIFDEVQTGFNLGRTFFWHEQFDLKSSKGEKEYPDCITMGKRAQLGVCLSRFAKSRQHTPHMLQLKRGLLHAQAINASTAMAMEKKVLAELKRLGQYFPTLVQKPRACGFAFAFDMPSNAQAMELINQRFSHGFMAYIAGEKTLRFRLNMATTDPIIDRLFEKLFVALVDLRDQNQVQRFSTGYSNHTIDDQKFHVSNIRFEELDENNFHSVKDEIQALEKSSYESGRRDSMDDLLGWLKVKNSLGLMLRCTLDGEDFFGGFAIGGPLEHSFVDGPNEDSQRDLHNTFYSADLALHEKLRGHGLGTKLKAEQIRRVAAIKNSDGSKRYKYMSGRNRLGQASTMTHINEGFKSYTLKIYDGQYGEENGQAIYYRLPLRKSDHQTAERKPSDVGDCTNNIQSPLQKTPSGLTRALEKNYLRSLACSKLTLSNWATPNLVRYSELLREVMPKCLNHAYFTSGRDEVVDKGLRSLRFHRQDADLAIGFSHQWTGNVSAAARSLSHDESQQKPFGFFDWPKIAHPQIVGSDESLRELKNILAQHESKKILGIVVELMGERSGFTFDDSFLAELARIRDNTGIPLVFIESTSAYFRNGQSLFYSDSLPVAPNMVWWYTGGQLGHVFVDDEYFVEKPLTLISTWDGDDISIARAYHNLLAASNGEWAKNILSFDESIKNISSPFPHFGCGTWHSFKVGDEEKLLAMQKLAKERGVQVGQGFDQSLMVCPKPDLTMKEFEDILKVVRNILS